MKLLPVITFALATVVISAEAKGGSSGGGRGISSAGRGSSSSRGGRVGAVAAAAHKRTKRPKKGQRCDPNDVECCDPDVEQCSSGEKLLPSVAMVALLLPLVI